MGKRSTPPGTKHGQNGSRYPILTNRDLDSIAYILSILVFKHSDGISIHLAHACLVHKNKQFQNCTPLFNPTSAPPHFPTPVRAAKRLVNESNSFVRNFYRDIQSDLSFSLSYHVSLYFLSLSLCWRSNSITISPYIVIRWPRSRACWYSPKVF